MVGECEAAKAVSFFKKNLLKEYQIVKAVVKWIVFVYLP
ncbi:hypothetical protein T15_0357 [Streptococcus suis T15]|nr:hypothetical protein T15_0357 [Streptococcus suis T15]